MVAQTTVDITSSGHPVDSINAFQSYRNPENALNDFPSLHSSDSIDNSAHSGVKQNINWSLQNNLSDSVFSKKRLPVSELGENNVRTDTVFNVSEKQSDFLNHLQNESSVSDSLTKDVENHDFSAKNLDSVHYKAFLSKNKSVVEESDQQLRDSIQSMRRFKDSIQSIAVQKMIQDSIKTYADLLKLKNERLDSINKMLSPSKDSNQLTSLNSSSVRTVLIESAEAKLLDSLSKVTNQVKGHKTKVKQLAEDKEEMIISKKNAWLDRLFFEGIIDPFSFEDEIAFQPALGFALSEKQAVGFGINMLLKLNSDRDQLLDIEGLRAFHKYNLSKDKIYTHTEINASIPQFSSSAAKEISDNTFQKTSYSLSVGGGYRLILFGSSGIDIQGQYRVLSLIDHDLTTEQVNDEPSFKLRIGIKLN